MDGIWPDVPHAQQEQKKSTVTINIFLNETYFSSFAVLFLISHITRPYLIFFCLFPLPAKAQSSILHLNKLHSGMKNAKLFDKICITLKLCILRQ